MFCISSTFDTFADNISVLLLQCDFERKTFTCNEVFLDCSIATFKLKI